MNELPADLADPLHLMNPYPHGQALGWAALFALLGLLIAWWRRRRRRGVHQIPRVFAAAPSTASRADIVTTIDEIRRRYQNADVRRGCHRLAEALRSHYAALSRQRLTTLTAREIMAVLGDTAVAEVFGLLAQLQFRRRLPTREELGDICDLATEATSRSGSR